MSVSIGIVIFDDVEELDFVGPWEVLTSAKKLAATDPAQEQWTVRTIAQHERPVRCAKGMRVLPDCTFDVVDALDIVVVPGGQGTRRELKNEVLLDWLRRMSPTCRFVTSVCSGALVLHAAGDARGKRTTTHWSVVEELRARGDVTVVEGVRFVRDGRLVTSAGVSAGIDMALWLVGQLRDPVFARHVQRAIEYHPAPPYTAEA
jgi:transcriptional regulator GlxA family with amidase domain